MLPESEQTHSSLKRFLVFCLIVIFAIIFFALVFIYSTQKSIIYAGASDDKPLIPAHVEEVKLATSYGLFLNASRSKTDSRAIVIYFHGNKLPAAHWLDRFSKLLNHGISTLLVEYPGYGGSGGEPDIDNITKTALAAYDYVIRRTDVDVLKVFSYGRSLGGGPAAILARDRNVAGLILESTYSSMAQLASENGYPAFLLSERYDTQAIVKNLSIASLIIHGSQDQLINKTHGQTLAKASNSGKYIELNCAHSGCPFQINEIVDFILTQSG